MPAATDVFDEGGWTYERLVDMLSEPANGNLDWRRFEIVDGALVVSPPPTAQHEAVVMQLAIALGPAVPSRLRLVAASRIGIGRSYRVSDVAVLTIEGYRSKAPSHSGRQVVLAIEIESPSSVTTDRVTKLAQ